MLQTHINIPERMEHHKVKGLSISLIKNGQISSIENHGLLEVNTNKKVVNQSIFNACSISKLLTSLIVLKLTDEGILNLDEDVNNVLVSWKINHKFDKKITLRNLLSHQSGVIDPVESFIELKTDIGIPSLVDILEGTSPYCSAPINIEYEPDSDFQYSDAGFCIIQQLVEDVTGKPFQDLAQQFIFNPLHMVNSSFPQHLSDEIGEHFSSGHNKNGELVNPKYPIYPYAAASGLWTTTSDLSKLIIELMNALHNKSQIGISVASANEMLNSQGCRNWTGLGVFLEGEGKEIELSSLGWGLGFQCLLVTYPHLRSGLVIMTNTDLGVHQLKGIIGEVYHSLKTMISHT